MLGPRCGACLVIGLAVATAGCEEETTPAQKRDVSIQLAAQVGAEPFACGTTFSLGTSGTRVAPLDFRLYVHAVRLVRSGGEEVEIELEDDGTWQRDGAVLIDFEDGSGTCQTGSAQTNTAIVGTVPEHDDYVAVRFRLGLPAELNHLDAATAPAPFNIPGMWWAWKGGYKFVRMDFDRVDLPAAEESAYYFHLGSTTCDGTPATGFSCAFTNLAEITLDLDIDSQAVVFDAAKLYEATDLALQPDFMTDFVPGCMAFEGDPECPAVFERLGMRFESTEQGAAQTVFSVR